MAQAKGRGTKVEIDLPEDEIDLPDPEEQDPAPPTEDVETFSLSDDEFEDEIEFDPFEHQKAKKAHPPSAWVQGPGAVTLLAEAARLLVKTTELKGELQEELPHVNVTALRKKRCLVVAPTTAEDLQERGVTWKEGRASFNVSKILTRAGFPVETRYRKRFKVHLVQNSKKGPILVIDMRAALDVKVLPKRKSKAKSKGAQ